MKRGFEWRGKGRGKFRTAAVALLFAVVHVVAMSAGAQERATSASNTRSESSLADRSGSYEPVPLAELLSEDEKVEEVSLEELMRHADRGAPAIRRARAKLERGRAGLEGTDVFTTYDPVASVGVERFPVGEFSYGETKVGLSQRFTIAGEQGARVSVARMRREVLESKLRERRWSVHTKLHRLYNRALVDIERLRLAHRREAFFERLLRIAETRFEAGESNRIAVQLSKAEYARAKEDVVDTESVLLSRLESLREVSGWEANSLPNPEGVLPEIRASRDAEEFRRAAGENNPRVETLQSAIELAEARSDYQNKKSWPDPVVGLFYKVKSPEAGPTEGGLVAQFSLPIPIWNRNKVGRLVQAEQRRVARTRLTTFRERLVSKVADAAQSLDAAARQAEVYGEEVVARFRRELKLLREGYRAGEFDITDVTVAQQRLLEGRRRALGARGMYYDAAARMERLTGEEFWNSIETPLETGESST